MGRAVDSHDLMPQAPRTAGRPWPVLLAALFLALACALLAASAYLQQQARRLTASAQELQAQLHAARQATAPGAMLPPTLTVRELPPHYTHLADVEALLQVAQQDNLQPAALAFRSERVEKLPVLLRIAEVRLEVDYPRLKEFIAQLLARFPHLYLDELRIDRGGDSAGKLQASLKLSFAYGSALPTPPAGASP